MKRVVGLVAAGAFSLALVTGCSSSDNSSSETSSAAPTTTSSSESATGSITVFAAASLKNSFTELGTEF
ncbi:MAG: molybdate-binding protein, partial [Rhodococcus sp. (in: high G+C Gram-positive bacteria)]